MNMTYLVTGGAGFIGGNFVHQAIDKGAEVINLDLLTYAGHPETLEDIAKHPLYHFIEGDIGDSTLVTHLFNKFKPDAVINFAAESHVDRSIDGPGTFIQTNVVATSRLLDASLQYWKSLDPEIKARFRFLHVSTDEVYGSLGATGLFTESSQYAPNSPYSASKAASDHLVRAWHHTYGLPVLTTNCSNNYGPWQYPEKLIPLVIHKVLAGESIPVYGDGSNIRDWLYVGDHVNAIEQVLEQGQLGEVYNVGGNAEQTNLSVVHTLCAILDELRPDPDGLEHKRLIEFVSDRPGHDQRYAIDASKIKSHTGWVPEESFESGIRKTVEWYLNHADWVNAVTKNQYQGERLGQHQA